MIQETVFQVVQDCNTNAQYLRKMAQTESRANIKKLLLEAAHQLDVATAELDYIATDSTVSI